MVQRMRWTSVLTLLGVGPGCHPLKDVWFIPQLLETEDGREKSPIIFTVRNKTVGMKILSSQSMALFGW
jgi:hypothetical protein